MIRRLIRTVGVALGLAAAALAPVARAAINSVAPTPANSLATIGQAHSLPLAWSALLLYVTAGPSVPIPFTITSTSGQFMLGGTVLGTVNNVVTLSGTVPSNVVTTVRVPETVIVPPAVTIQANRLGAQSITYVRVFNDGTTPVSGSETILIGGSGLATFGITREALSFDDGAAVRVVQVGDKLSARAQIDFTGSGGMIGLWEIAGPSSTAGQPQYRELQPVTRGLLGRAPLISKSPDLPTATPGFYLVRLRIAQPLPGFDPPILAYHVGEANSGPRGAFTEMSVIAPGEGALLDAETRFSWHAVAGASAYKIELFAIGGSDPFGLPDIGGGERVDPARVRAALAAPPAAGMLVAGTQTQVTLSGATRARLQSRRSYFWRVQAIGADGSVIGAAQVRQLRVP